MQPIEPYQGELPPEILGPLHSVIEGLRSELVDAEHDLIEAGERIDFYQTLAQAAIVNLNAGKIEVATRLLLAITGEPEEGD